MKLPGSYIVGFGTTVDGVHSNPYPVKTIDAPMSLWDKEVIIPSAERDHFADLLSYGIEAEPLVAVVQVVPDGVYTGGLRVVETLAGNLPRSITMPCKWLVPLVMDDPVRAGDEITETDAFIIPGVVLPNFRYVDRIVDKLRAATDADAVGALFKQVRLRGARLLKGLAHPRPLASPLACSMTRSAPSWLAHPWSKAPGRLPRQRAIRMALLYLGKPVDPPPPEAEIAFGSPL